MENQGPVILAADRDLQNEPNLRGPCAQAIPSFAPIIGAALREIRKADFIVNTQFWSQYCSAIVIGTDASNLHITDPAKGRQRRAGVP